MFKFGFFFKETNSQSLFLTWHSIWANVHIRIVEGWCMNENVSPLRIFEYELRNEMF